MPELSDRVLNQPRQLIRYAMAQIEEAEKKYSDVINLTVGDPDFDTRVEIVKAAIDASKSSAYQHYLPSTGLPELRSAIVSKLRRANRIGSGIDEDNIIITAGGVNGINLALMAVGTLGDTILIPELSWPNVAIMAYHLGLNVERYDLDKKNGFLPKIEKLRDYILSCKRCKIIYINSPQNPTGAVYPASIIEQFAVLAKENDLWVISDEAYEDIVFDQCRNYSPALIDLELRNVISTYTLSKTYAMTGWRVGYLLANKKVASAIGKVVEAQIACVNGPAQAAGLAAFSIPSNYIKHMVDTYQERRNIALDLLSDAGLYKYTPRGTFYLLIDISHTGMSSIEFTEYLLKNFHVGVVPGIGFGKSGDQFIRVSLTRNTSHIREGIYKICEACSMFQSKTSGLLGITG